MITTNSLRLCGLFSELSDDQLDLLTPSAHIVTVPTHQLLFTAGQRATHFYVIAEGCLALEMALRETPVHSASVVTLCTLGPTQAVGYWALIEPYFYTFSGRALRPVGCVAIEGEAARRAMADDVQIGYALMQKMAGQLATRLNQARLALGYQSRGFMSLLLGR